MSVIYVVAASVAHLVVGLVAGWFYWRDRRHERSYDRGYHQGRFDLVADLMFSDQECDVPKSLAIFREMNASPEARSALNRAVVEWRSGGRRGLDCCEEGR